jgi:hypothetical protein
MLSLEKIEARGFGFTNRKGFFAGRAFSLLKNLFFRTFKNRCPEAEKVLLYFSTA